jgi:hypothetical protein
MNAAQDEPRLSHVLRGRAEIIARGIVAWKWKNVLPRLDSGARLNAARRIEGQKRKDGESAKKQAYGSFKNEPAGESRREAL